MKPHRSLRFFASVAITIIFAIASHYTAWGAVKEKMYAFDRMDGTGYRTGLTLDSSGNLWGISVFGGTFGYGDVFELSRPPSGRMVEIYSARPAKGATSAASVPMSAGVVFEFATASTNSSATDF